MCRTRIRVLLNQEWEGNTCKVLVLCVGFKVDGRELIPTINSFISELIKDTEPIATQLLSAEILLHPKVHDVDLARCMLSNACPTTTYAIEPTSA